MSQLLLLSALVAPAVAADAAAPASGDTLTFETERGAPIVDHASSVWCRCVVAVGCRRDLPAGPGRRGPGLWWPRHPTGPSGTSLSAGRPRSRLCASGDLFGEDRFVSCLTGTCGDLSRRRQDRLRHRELWSCARDPPGRQPRVCHRAHGPGRQVQPGCPVGRAALLQAGLFRGSDGSAPVRGALEDVETLDLSDVSTQTAAGRCWPPWRWRPAGAGGLHPPHRRPVCGGALRGLGQLGRRKRCPGRPPRGSLGEGQRGAGRLQLRSVRPRPRPRERAGGQLPGPGCAGFADRFGLIPTCSGVGQPLNEAVKASMKRPHRPSTPRVTPVLGGRRYDGRMEIETRPAPGQPVRPLRLSLTVRAGTLLRPHSRRSRPAGQVEAGSATRWCRAHGGLGLRDRHQRRHRGRHGRRGPGGWHSSPTACPRRQSTSRHPTSTRPWPGGQILTTHSTLPAPVDPALRTRLAEVAARLGGMYGAGKAATKQARPGPTALSNVLAEGGAWDEQLQAWADWRTVSPAMQPLYAELVGLGNQGAQDLGYANLASSAVPVRHGAQPWRGRSAVGAGQAAVRGASLLRTRLGGATAATPSTPRACCPRTRRATCGPRAGRNSTRSSSPTPVRWPRRHPGPQGPEVDPIKMVKTNEAFFTSLGLDPMPETFWERSMFPTRRQGRGLPPAWDGGHGQRPAHPDMHQPTLDELVTIHELGHSTTTSTTRRCPSCSRTAPTTGSTRPSRTPSPSPSRLATSRTLASSRWLKKTPRRCSTSRCLTPCRRWPSCPRAGGGPVALGCLRRVPEGTGTRTGGRCGPSTRVGPTGPRPGRLRPRSNTIPPARPTCGTSSPPCCSSSCTGDVRAAGHEGPLHTCSVYGSEAAGDQLEKLLSWARASLADALEAMAGTSRCWSAAVLLCAAAGHLAEQNKRQPAVGRSPAKRQVRWGLVVTGLLPLLLASASLPAAADRWSMATCRPGSRWSRRAVGPPATSRSSQRK